MKCESLHKLVLEKNTSELTISENDLIQNHIVGCNECREFMKKINNVEGYLFALNQSTPIPVNDELMADNIFSNIRNQNKMHKSSSFLNDFYYWIQKDVVRYAFIAILFSIVGFYGYQEYYTVKRIYSLEKQLTHINKNNSNAAVNPIQLNKDVTWVYDLYKYLSGTTSYWQIRGDIIVINKSNLKKLLMDYDKLSKDEQNEILKLKQVLYPELIDEQVTDKGDLLINNNDLERKLKSLNSIGDSHEK